MTEQSPQKQKLNPFAKGNQLIKTSINLISGISVLGSGLVWTGANATTDTLVIPDAPSASDTGKPAETSSVEPARVPQAVSAPQSAPEPEPVRITKVKLSAPKISVTQSPIQTSGENLVKNSYIDQTNYNYNAGNTVPNRDTTYNAGNTVPNPKPQTVVITERATGCKTIISGSSFSGGNCGAVSIKQPSRKTESLAVRVIEPKPTYSYYSPSRQVRLTRRDLSQIALTGQTKPYSNYRARHYSARTIQNGPNVVYSQSISTVPLNPNPPEYSRAPRQLVEQAIQYGNGNTSLIFPLSIPASISSAFGWRIHPITGTGRMHSGTDLAAPLGTPVLAAYPGEVATAESLGGYGLTVILRHLEGTQESRYAHLSQILVQPGQWVEQGAVIGLVGSTGFSTGPHLHFEWRHNTDQGWVAVDAGLHLQMALDNMMQALQNAQSQPNPNNDQG